MPCDRAFQCDKCFEEFIICMCSCQDELRKGISVPTKRPTIFQVQKKNTVPPLTYSLSSSLYSREKVFYALVSLYFFCVTMVSIIINEDQYYVLPGNRNISKQVVGQMFLKFNF